MHDKTSLPPLLDLFQDLSPEDQDALKALVTPLTAPRGTLFYSPTDAGDAVYFLRQGIVQFYRITPEGKRLVLCSLNDDGMFGEMSQLAPSAHHTFAEAFTDCSLWMMQGEDVQKMMMDRPQVAMKLLAITGRRLRAAEEQMEALAFKSIPMRLAERLLRLADEQDEVVGLTHQDLAEMIGTYRETTTQTLNDMKAAGLIAIGRRRLTLLDKAGLQTFGRS